MPNLNKKKLKIIVKVICAILIALMWMMIAHNIGYKKGFSNGAELGVNVTLDTVRTIIINQLKSDTTATKVVLIIQDTNVYIFSRKTLVPKDYINRE